MTQVLIVDDAAFMRMILKNTLEKNGFDVVGEAVNGLDGVEKCKQLNPDIVTLDITMPEMDGLTALREIRKTNKNVSIIMCSAMGQQAMVIEAIQNGAKDFIVKPFQEDRVVEALRKVVEKH